MFSTKGNRVLIVIIMVLLFCLLSACGTNQRPGPTTPDNQPPQTQNQPNDDQNRSQEISRKLEQEVEEINSATVIITGNQAWVGVDAKANAQISEDVYKRQALLSAAGADAFGVGSYISGARAIDMTMDIKEISGQPVAKRGRIPGMTTSNRLVKIQ